jgi:hypothetical protein
LSISWVRMNPFCFHPYSFFIIHFYTLLPSLIFLASEKQNILIPMIVSFLRLNLLLIYLCMHFWFVTTFSKSFNLLFFQIIYYPSWCCDFVQNSVDKVWSYTLASESSLKTNIHPVMNKAAMGHFYGGKAFFRTFLSVKCMG